LKPDYGSPNTNKFNNQTSEYFKTDGPLNHLLQNQKTKFINVRRNTERPSHNTLRTPTGMKKMMTQKSKIMPKLSKLKNNNSVKQIVNLKTASTSNSQMFKSNLQKNNSKKNLSLKLKEMDKRDSKIEKDRNAKNPFLAQHDI
jgi:hypothetical protein